MEHKIVFFTSAKYNMSEVKVATISSELRSGAPKDDSGFTQ